MGRRREEVRSHTVLKVLFLSSVKHFVDYSVTKDSFPSFFLTTFLVIFNGVYLFHEHRGREIL